MKHIKMILIVICVLFFIAAAGLVYLGIQQEPSANACRLPMSDLVNIGPAKFENLKTVMC